MKKFILPLIFLFISTSLFAQITGDFRTRQNGNWNSFNRWQRYDGSTWVNASSGEIPTSTSAVTIRATHTITIDADANCLNLTIENTATLSGNANTLYLYGNLTNNGTLNLYTSSGTALVFAGTGSATFSGTGATTDILTIEVAKDLLASTVQLNTSNFSVQDDPDGLSTPQFLTLTTGTFRISGSFTMSSQVFIGGAAYTFNSDEGFWLDNSNFTILGQDGQI